MALNVVWYVLPVCCHCISIASVYLSRNPYHIPTQFDNQMVFLRWTAKNWIISGL